ncbi:fasciclin domain-containing protein [Pontibacter fetidus]|uniref:Fasciclin domain-containing protein n=1 Tax=Pontibacter fetidus TaxID=2700082 RepID=A0A6B2HB53_9BACT|nr:fasciclin domain-containing protein [Pontibacter fetidus]NDK57072.1 fasciclin domain-containing protein [Pontibacter fetidus]
MLKGIDPVAGSSENKHSMRTIAISKLACCLLLSIFLSGCGSESQRENSTMSEASAKETAQALANQPVPVTTDTENKSLKTITDQAAADPELSIFAKAFEVSGLAKTLNSTGPYTVFMPSNEAFEALPGSTLDDLMKPENKQQLAAILNSHIVAGKLDTATLQHGSKIKTLGNEQLEVSKQQDLVMINGAEIKKANILSSNGVIHMIDKVLVPEKQ